MKNLSILVFFALATFGFWVFSSAYILAPFWTPGAGYRIYLGLFGVPDLLAVLLFSAWAILVARLGQVFFSGAAAYRFRFAATAFVILIFLYGRGAFIPSNFSMEFFAQAVFLATLISVAAGMAFAPAQKIPATRNTAFERTHLRVTTKPTSLSASRHALLRFSMSLWIVL